MHQHKALHISRVWQTFVKEVNNEWINHREFNVYENEIFSFCDTSTEIKTEKKETQKQDERNNTF